MGLKSALNAAMGVMHPGFAEAAAAFARLHPGRRAAFVLEEATRNPQLQQRLVEAAASDAPNVLFARIAAEFEPPAAGSRYAMEANPLPTPNPEPQLRAGVAEELGPFYLEAPMESVNEAHDATAAVQPGFAGRHFSPVAVRCHRWPILHARPRPGTSRD